MLVFANTNYSHFEAHSLLLTGISACECVCVYTHTWQLPWRYYLGITKYFLEILYQ